MHLIVGVHSAQQDIYTMFGTVLRPYVPDIASIDDFYAAE